MLGFAKIIIFKLCCENMKTLQIKIFNMMDRITKSLMTELLANLELKSEGESKDFEKFVNYVVTSSEYNKTFDVDSITVGEGNDTGIDGISIIANGQLVESTDEIDDLLERN